MLARVSLAFAFSATIAMTSLLAADPVAPSTWTIDGTKREAIVHLPTKSGEGTVPIVFNFHGHRGAMRQVEKQGIHKLWPEAIVVYPQGLPTVTPNDPEGKFAGWQIKAGDDKDRDLKFVDAMLKDLRAKHKVDDARIYATGHSNGGMFTYLLWTNRGKEFTAFAPCAALASSLRAAKDVPRRPILHITGEADETVKFANQEQSIAAVRKYNECETAGKPWAKSGKLVGTKYVGKDGADVVAVIHPGTHKYPEEAPELIVKFFREHVKK